MATVKNGIITQSPEWWKHLRKAKCTFWKRERKETWSAVDWENIYERRAATYSSVRMAAEREARRGK